MAHRFDDRVAEMTVADAAAGRMSATVYERILELIVTGAAPLNSRLPSEADLARRFAASRPVVREALARLRDDGIIVSRQGSGSYVRRRPDDATLSFVPLSSLADIQRCFEFRVSIESAAAELAALRWTPETLAAIEAALVELETCIREGTLGVEADERFHLAIVRASQNQYHLSVMASLLPHISVGMRLLRNLSLLRPPARSRLVQDEHVAIIEAIRARDPVRAGKAMEAHILNARRRIFGADSPVLGEPALTTTV